MGLPGCFERRSTQHALAGIASVALHAGIIVWALYSGGRHEGVGHSDATLTQLVMIEAPDVDRADGIELLPIAPAVELLEPTPELQIQAEPLLAASEAINTEHAEEPSSAPDEPSETTAAIIAEAVQPATTFQMSAEEQAALSQRLAKLAEELQDSPETPLEWEENGKQYSARMIWERARDGTALDRVVAQVSASDQGKILSTRVMLKRLAFSQFTQMVDRWDPMVQLHDDVIVGRFHSNSRFNIMHDPWKGPKFLGKVTTAARSYDMQSSGRKRQAEIFRGGVETRTSRINLPEALQPFAWAPANSDARVHELTEDTRIRFFADGSYMWRANGSPEAHYLNAPSKHPVYFIANLGTTLYVQGVVAGNILVYSPNRIVIEDDLTYAHDPRQDRDSRDFLGLVSDRYIEVAPPGVTGPGDLEIHAALFAGRRFVVRDIDYSRSATLRIYGSLSAGSLSASEPRYATQIEYDPRFENRRPPGFPLTSRYETDDWDGRWVEKQEQMAEETF